MDITDDPGRPINRETAEHYVWGANCDGWHLVKQPSLSVIEEHMPPRTSEVQHHHSHARQFFFVIRGELRLEVEGRGYELRPGDGLEIHPGQKHQAINRSGAEVRMLVVSQPPSHGDRVLSS